MREMLHVPGALMPAFEQMKRDFDTVTAQWMAWGEESEASVVAIRDGLRRHLADRADPDQYGVNRVERLRCLFAFWRDLARTICPLGVAVVPTLGFEVERRIADRKWSEGEGRSAR